MSNNGTSEGMSGGIDTRLIREALTSEVKRMFIDELQQFHERVEQSLEQPRNPPGGRRREKLPRRGVRVEEEEYEGDGLKDVIDHNSVVSDKSMGEDLEKTCNSKPNIFIYLFLK